MYIEQIAVVLCKVAEIATACRGVLMLILLWGMFFLIRIDTPPEALSPMSCMLVVLLIIFHVCFIIAFLKCFLETYNGRILFSY